MRELGKVRIGTIYLGRPPGLSFNLQVPSLELNHLDADDKFAQICCQSEFVDVCDLGCFSECSLDLGHKLLWSEPVKPGQEIALVGMSSCLHPGGP